ncbi:LolA family protein [Geotalea uraniireducens]|uniref:Outer membrane lipoprotein carrier protein LolA n=1 Tax=Geotalea uraniireducens (strain Rf4) TaxID=351605 RepID=A5GBW2_GEOUR|nr:outer membrane lipoprotein carrier protein LolA [Geotalea uraniireducens]ABQ24929.1 outer membrane lipoprotein carrier protein LolA [Geotalea uraniireducens Rf4]
MRTMRAFISLLLLLQMAISAEAAVTAQVNVGLQDVVDTVEKSYRVLSDVTTDFFQRSTMAEKKREMRAEGQMFLKTAGDSEPLKFRFDYFRPTTHEIVSNGITMWMYLSENRTVIQSDVSFVFNPLGFNPDRNRASNFLQGLGRISRDFLTTFSPQGRDIEGNYILELNPRRATATIEKLFIVVQRDAVYLYTQKRMQLGRQLTEDEFRQILNSLPLGSVQRDQTAFPVLSTTVIDHQGNTTIMEFSNVKTDTRISDQLFEFTVPAAVEVVRPPTHQ